MGNYNNDEPIQPFRLSSNCHSGPGARPTAYPLYSRGCQALRIGQRLSFATSIISSTVINLEEISPSRRIPNLRVAPNRVANEGQKLFFRF